MFFAHLFSADEVPTPETGTASPAVHPPACLLSDLGGCYTAMYHWVELSYVGWILNKAGKISDTTWYSEAGLVPQAIILTLFDCFFTVVGEFISFAWFLKNRAMGRWRWNKSQKSINEAYRPPEFPFSTRYGFTIKIVANVLVFAPAAPLLYFIGGAALLWAFFVVSESHGVLTESPCLAEPASPLRVAAKVVAGQFQSPATMP